MVVMSWLWLLAGCGCEHDGQAYGVGDSRPASCNTCTCEVGGGWSCTLIGCADPSLCPVAAGDVFTSVEDLECGQGTTGEVLCSWSITLGEGTWTWQHSDVGESGSWTCDQELVNAFTDSNQRLDVTWDAEREILGWEGVDYTRVE